MADREKSALYPAVTWNDCIDLLEKIDSFKAKSVSYSELAAKYGLNSPSTKSFSYRIGAAKQYGLITTTGGNTLQLTETGRKILFPTDSSSRPLLLECFTTPPLYAKLVSKYDSKALPKPEILSNVLMTEFNITRNAKDIAAKCFLESAEQLNLIKAGVLAFSEEKTSSSSSSSITDPISESQESPEFNDPSILKPNISSESDYIIQSIPFSNGKVAKLSIPIDAAEDDLYLLYDLFKAVLNRKFKLQL